MNNEIFNMAQMIKLVLINKNLVQLSKLISKYRRNINFSIQQNVSQYVVLNILIPIQINSKISYLSK